MHNAIILICATLSCAAIAECGDAAMERAKTRLAGLSLEEKVLLTAGSGSMTMRVPHANREWQFSDNSQTVRADMERWSWDCISTNDEATVLPNLSALAATWNRERAADFGHVMGEQARARGKDQMLGPGVNIMRNPLCGRNWEYFSEDPCLTSKLVVPEIKAMQSHGVAATVKHFALNNQEWNRGEVDTYCDERTMNEIYFPAFEAAIKDAGVWSVMTAYNKVNGDWCSENAFLQKDILRDRWSFNGMIVTDWGGAKSTVKCALNGGGVEMNCGGGIRHFVNPKESVESGKLVSPLLDAVKSGDVPEAVVDEIALHTLWTMEKANFFGEREAGERNTPRHQRIAREIGEEAIVLLKNDDGVLPLNAAKVKKIVVVGKLADTEMTKKGWSAEGKPPYEITPLMGLREKLGVGSEELGVGREERRIVFLPLVASDDAGKVHDVIESSVTTFDTTAEDKGMSIRAWEVEYYKQKEPGGPWGDVKHGFARRVDLVGEGYEASPCVRWHTKLLAPETGTYTFGIAMDHRGGATIKLDGEEIANGNECESLSAQRDLEAGKLYDCMVEYRANSGEHFMRFGWRLPSESGSIEDIRREATDADAVIVFTGTEVGHGQALECEGEDRPNLKLPDGHDAAIAKILSWKLQNLVIVTHSGAPLELPWVEKASTILHQPYLGQEAGRALANVLFGDVNPSGKLPCTWPKRYEDTPVAQCGTYNAESVTYNEGLLVGYRWYDAKDIEPLFPFGYGLSYTTWEMKNAECRMKNGVVEVSVEVSNTGKVAGKEIVQLYVDGIKGEPKTLRDFAKVSLEPGETKTITFTLTPRDFAYWDIAMHDWKTDAGGYRILIGASSRDIRVTADIAL